MEAIIAGLERQDKDFWRYTLDYDFIGLCETYLEEKGWDRIKDKLACSHEWVNIRARRQKKKGRAIGGILIGIKKSWIKSVDVVKTTALTDGVAHTRLICGNVKSNIFTIYNNGERFRGNI